MLNKTLDYIKRNRMIDKGDRIVVGVSGGADSVCLLYVLLEACKQEDASLVAVHINHGIRGAEADRDEEYVKELCSHLGVEFYRFFYDVKKIAEKEGLSEEEAGRKVRYDSFLEICNVRKCNKIAIAHNKNDNAETVLFHLFRGTGIKGLSGIDPSRIINTAFGIVTVIRPLLGIERSEIEEFLYSQGIKYQVDSTNLTEDYSRNKIRSRILGYAVKEINSGAVGNINEAAGQLREIEEYIASNVAIRSQALVKQSEKVYRIGVKELQEEPIVLQKGIIRTVLENLAESRKDLEAKHVDAVLSLSEKQVGRYIHLPYDMIAEREYQEIKFFRDKSLLKENTELEIMAPIRIKIPGRIFLPRYKKILETELFTSKKNDPIPKSSCVKWFDYDKIENAVELRTRKEGDYIQINDLGGRKKIKDYFIDKKIPKKMRDSQILITDGSHVMWIPGVGERMSEKYKVDETTTKILLMKMFDLEENEDDR
jgi:tRNA(Ile)-lysidine synthase